MATIQSKFGRRFDEEFKREVAAMASRPGEFKHVGIAQERGHRGGQVLRTSATEDRFLVRGEPGAFVKQRSPLALQLTNRPVSMEAFDLVKSPFEGIRQSLIGQCPAWQKLP